MNDFEKGFLVGRKSALRTALTQMHQALQDIEIRLRAELKIAEENTKDINEWDYLEDESNFD